MFQAKVLRCATLQAVSTVAERRALRVLGDFVGRQIGNEDDDGDADNEQPLRPSAATLNRLELRRLREGGRKSRAKTNFSASSRSSSGSSLLLTLQPILHL